MEPEDDANYYESLGYNIADAVNLRELITTGSTTFDIGQGIDDINEPADLKKRIKNDYKATQFAESDHDEAFNAMQIREGKRYSGLNKEGKSIAGETIAQLLKENVCYDNISKRMENVTEDGGVKKLITTPGFGNQIQEGQVVYINYDVWLEGSDTPLDDSRRHTKGSRTGEPFRFKVGSGQVIPALDIGVSSMQPFETAKFLSDYQYAYGKLGCVPQVPPKTRAMVTVEVIDVSEGAIKNNLVDMEHKQRLELPFDELYKGVQELKRYGNDYVQSEEYDKAKKEYKLALKITQDILTPNEVENMKREEMMYTLLINMAHCRIMTRNFKSAKKYCEGALKLGRVPKPKKLKAYFRLAKCFDELGDIHRAKKNIDEAKNVDPMNSEVHDLYEKIVGKLVKDQNEEKNYAKNMFK